MLIFDIGANIGEYAIANYDNNKIISIEASPQTFSILKTNVKDYSNIICENYAATNSTDEFVTFYDCPTHNTIASLNRDWLESDFTRFGSYEKFVKPILVKSITIDALIQKYGTPDIIKIDVEGAEDIVVKSLSQKIPLLCYEWCAEMREVNSRCVRHLSSIGYTRFEIMFDDSYTERPSSFLFTADETIDYIDSTEDKNHWGMVWCK
jgi:FkbM family methyltransferase